jgi:hypothetical protein
VSGDALPVHIQEDISAMAMSRESNMAALQVIRRTPLLAFVESVWLVEHQIDQEIISMLPAKIENVTADQLAEVERLIAYNEGINLEAVSNGT